jgi:hypothetical protein
MLMPSGRKRKALRLRCGRSVMTETSPKNPSAISKIFTSDGRIIPDWESSALSSLADFMGALSKLASYLFFLVAFASVLGWLRAQAYLSTMGARWLLTELSPVQLLVFSYPLVYVTLLIVPNLIYDATEFKFTPSRLTKILVRLTLLGGLLGILAMLVTGRPFLSFLLTFFQSYLYLYGSFAVLLYIAFCLHENGGRFAGYHFFSFVLFFVLFYQAPSILGREEGKLDRDPSSKVLPLIVNKKGSPTKWRLLFQSGDRSFAIKPQAEKLPLVKLFKTAEITLTCEGTQGGCGRF